MAIEQTDILYLLSGGAANAAPLASLGGAKSSVPAPLGIFDSMSGAESTAGSVEFRCVYVHNAHATLPLVGAVLWMSANTPSATTTIEVGIGTAAMNGVEQTVGSETSAPSGVSFSPAASLGGGVALGDIPPGQGRSVWFRRTVQANTVAVNDTFTVMVTGDTAP